MSINRNEQKKKKRKDINKIGRKLGVDVTGNRNDVEKRILAKQMEENNMGSYDDFGDHESEKETEGVDAAEELPETQTDVQVQSEAAPIEDSDSSSNENPVSSNDVVRNEAIIPSESKENFSGKAAEGIDIDENKLKSQQSDQKGESVMSDDSKKDTLETFQQDINQAWKNIQLLQDRFINLYTGANISETVIPGSDHDFVKKLIENEIRMLELAYKGLRDLVIRIQDRQEAIYTKFSNANSKTTEAISQLQISAEQSDKNIQAEFSEKLENSQTIIYDKINEVNAELSAYVIQTNETLSSTINATIADTQKVLGEAQSELSSTVTTLKGDLENAKNSISQNDRNIKAEHQSLKNNKESSLRILAQYVNKLIAATGKSQEMSKYGLDASMKKLENYGSV